MSRSRLYRQAVRPKGAAQREEGRGTPERPPWGGGPAAAKHRECACTGNGATSQRTNILAVRQH